MPNQDMSVCSLSRLGYAERMIKRTSLNLDLDLVKQARDALGSNGTTDTIHRALEEVVRAQKLRRLARHRFELTPEQRDWAWRD
jgi:Arc/MetJ family transcription regulator